jgi:hypothetical protein
MSIRFVNGKFITINKTVAFVTFSNGKYLGFEKDFERSVLNIYPNASVFCFHDFSEIQSPHHSVSPYAFKVYCIEKVRQLGFSVIVWSDCINRLEKSIDSIFQETSQKGIYLQGDVHASGLFANDKCLSYFGITRDDAMKIEAIYACIMIFDFRNPVTSIFFDRWKKACQDGIFIGNWNNNLLTESQDPRCRGHRHDQSCTELISYQLGIPRSKALLGDKSEHYFSSFRYPV